MLEKCLGTGCPYTDSCVRYAPKIDFKREMWLAKVPYNPYSRREIKCNFYIDILGDNEVVEKANDIINGKKTMPD